MITTRSTTRGDVWNACHPPLQYLSNQKQTKKNRLPYETTIFCQDQDEVEMKSKNTSSSQKPIEITIILGEKIANL